MTTNTMISVQTINTTLPSFLDERLNKATQRIISIYTDAAKYADTKNRELAKIFSEVAEKKSYEKDGFKSVADYANTIFGIKRQNAYVLAAAGKIYNDPNSPEELKAMSPSKLAEVASINTDKVVKAITDGTISKDTTQRDLRDFANKVRDEEREENEKRNTRENKSRNDPKYTATVYSRVYNNLTNSTQCYTEREWDKYFLGLREMIVQNKEDVHSEIIPIAPIRDSDGKIIKRRKLYILSVDAIVVEFTRTEQVVNDEGNSSDK